MKKPHYFHSPVNYTKALLRLQNNIRSGRFATYTQQKKSQVWNRLCRYARQLGIQLKASLATACIAAGLSFTIPATGQTFTQQSGAGNPLNEVDIGDLSVPTFVDIDGDGDMDAFIGESYGTIIYYQNTGTPTVPIFTEQTGETNPLDGVDVGYHSAPVFVDIDHDGDMDAFIGTSDGTIFYYKNTGTSLVPIFEEQTGTNNPFDLVDVGSFARPCFVDIDGDLDKDVFIGKAYGSILYYENTGTATAPIFTPRTGTDNPWDGISITDANPAFLDIDSDGDMDAFTGQYYGKVNFYRNTGTAAAPIFTREDGANPFAGVFTPYRSTPAFVDIDGDGDMDVFVGNQEGTFQYFVNNTIILPLHLVSFSGGRHLNYNELQWQISGEVNSKWFEVERSGDGANFIKIATINTAGNGNHNYTIRDNTFYKGKMFYRLKMVDMDGRFTYSHVIWINSEAGSIVIYPNPATDILNINTGDATLLKTNAGVYDGSGRLLQNILIKSNQQQINVKPLAKGIYIIKFADGAVQDFIKE